MINQTVLLKVTKIKLPPSSDSKSQPSSPRGTRSPRIVQDESPRHPLSTTSSSSYASAAEKITHTEPRFLSPSSSSSSSSSSNFPQSASSKPTPVKPVKSTTSHIAAAGNTLAQWLVDDRLKEDVVASSLLKKPQIDSSFHVQRIPNPISYLASKSGLIYISSKQLLANYFEKYITQSAAWKDIERIHASFKKMQSTLSEPIEEDQRDAYAKCIVSLLTGEAGKLEKSKLPVEVRDFLVFSDHYFHEKILENKNTKTMSTDEIDEARFIYFNELLGSKILGPLFLQLSASDTSNTDLALQDAIKNHLDQAIKGLRKDFFATSFGSASPELQKKISSKLVEDMQDQQQKIIAKRAQQLSLGSISQSQQAKANRPVSPRSPKHVEVLRAMRAKEKALDKQIKFVLGGIGIQSLSGDFVEFLHEETKILSGSIEKISIDAIRNNLLLVAQKYQSKHSSDADEYRSADEFIRKLTEMISAEDKSIRKAIDSIGSMADELETELLLDELDFGGVSLDPQRASSLDESESTSDSQDEVLGAPTTSVDSIGQATANSSTSNTNDASPMITTTTSSKQS